jgi:hypothetical protein
MGVRIGHFFKTEGDIKGKGISFGKSKPIQGIPSPGDVSEACSQDEVPIPPGAGNRVGLSNPGCRRRLARSLMTRPIPARTVSIQVRKKTMTYLEEWCVEKSIRVLLRPPAGPPVEGDDLVKKFRLSVFKKTIDSHVIPSDAI